MVSWDAPCLYNWGFAFLVVLLLALDTVDTQSTLQYARTAEDLVDRIESGAVHIGLLADIDLEAFLSEQSQASFRNSSMLPFEIQPTTKSITGFCKPPGIQTGTSGLNDVPCTITTSRSVFKVSAQSLLLSNLNLKISPTFTADSPFLYDWTQVELVGADRSSIWMSRVSFNGTGSQDDLYHTGIRAVQSYLYAERCHFHQFNGAHGSAIELVASSSLVLYESVIMGNRAGVRLPSDLQTVADLRTAVLPFSNNYISSRTMLKKSTFADNMPDTSSGGDLVSFDSTIIYKDDEMTLDVGFTCGGGTACKEYMTATFQPLACSGNAVVDFLNGRESWVSTTQQELASSINGPSERIKEMPGVNADCPKVVPKGRSPPEQMGNTEWIVIVAIGGGSVVLAVIGQTIPVILAFLHWCCLGCGSRSGLYEP